MRKALIILLLLSGVVFAQDPWKFIVTGDSRSSGASVNNGVNTTILNEIAAEIVSHDVDFVLFPGDLVAGSSTQATLQSQLTTWRTCMQPVYNAGIGVYPVRGNHETGSLAAWNNHFSGAYALPQNGPAGEVNLTYSVAHKNMLVLALDQYVNLHRVNQAWVNAQLSANTRAHVFTFGHEPAFKVDHADCLDEYVTERNAFWVSLRSAGCKFYACGHDHFLDHTIIDDNDGNPGNNIHQLLVGTAGAPLRAWDALYDGFNSGLLVEQWHHREQFGYLLVEVVDDSTLYTVWYERDPATGSYMPLMGSVDLQLDGVINELDLLAVANQWLRDDCKTGNVFCGGADIDFSTRVNSSDFAYLAEQWQMIVPIIKEFQVNSSADDAEQTISTGAMSLVSSDLELATDSSSQLVGIRFVNVTIPRNAQIANAYLQFTCDTATNVNPCNLMVYAENADNAATFTTSANNIGSRTPTAGIAWNPPTWTLVSGAGMGERTPNLASQIETVVSRAGWQSGNAMVFVITGSGKRMAMAYDVFPSASPKLVVQFE